MAFGQFFGFLWFFLLFVAGVTSSISLAAPAISFLEDEFNLSRKEASIIFAVITFILCQPAIFFLGNGVVDEMDFWGVSVCLVIFATVEIILFGWVYGMDKAWQQLHIGSDIKIPKIYRFIIKYITPLMLITILTVWVVQKWKGRLLMENVPEQDKPFMILTRIGLMGLMALIGIMVWIVWKRRENPTDKKSEVENEL
jgi:SNF family Na+-dependent transporter